MAVLKSEPRIKESNALTTWGRSPNPWVSQEDDGPARLLVHYFFKALYGSTTWS